MSAQHHGIFPRDLRVSGASGETVVEAKLQLTHSDRILIHKSGGTLCPTCGRANYTRRAPGAGTLSTTCGPCLDWAMKVALAHARKVRDAYRAPSVEALRTRSYARPRAYVVAPAGGRYAAYSASEAARVRDTVGGTIEWL